MSILSRSGARAGLFSLGLALSAAMMSFAGPAAADPDGERLGDLIASRLRAEGPFFTPEERTVIERACGYAPGEWDGFELDSMDGVFRCINGRRVDSPEVRRVVAAARPRIQARVERVMQSAEVRAAITRVSERATARAMRAVAAAWDRDGN